MTRAVYFLYQFLLTIFMPFGLLGWFAASMAKPRLGEGWRERLGFWKTKNSGAVWIHGASLGEIRSVRPLIAALKDRGMPLIVTATSITGRNEAADALRGYGEAFLLPVDHFIPLYFAFERAEPSVLVVAETELWPGLVSAATARGIETVIVTGRVSGKAMPRYMRIRPLVKRILDMVAFIQAQSPMDAERYIALGADPGKVYVGGSMKFDLAPPDGSDQLAVSLRRSKAGGWRVIVGGSVHPGEAGQFFEGVAIARKSGLQVGLVVAPRHLEKVTEIERELAEAGFGAARWSELGKPLEASIIQNFAEGKAIVVDRVGLLSRIYGGAEVAFVGGSLVPAGGHNLLEPLVWGVPVVFGPHMTNAPDIRDEVLRRGIGTLATGAEPIAEALKGYLADEKARAGVKRGAAEFFEANRGALLMAVEAVSAAKIRAGEAE